MKAKWERLNTETGRASANPVTASTPEAAAFEFGVVRPRRRQAVMNKGRPHFPWDPVEVLILRRAGAKWWRVFVLNPSGSGYIEASKR